MATLYNYSNTPFTDWYSFTNKLLKIRHRLTFGVVWFLWGVQLNCRLPLVLMKLRARKYMGLCKRISYVARVKKERDLLGINIAQGPVCQLMLYIKIALGKLFAWKVYAREWEIQKQFLAFSSRKINQSSVVLPQCASCELLFQGVPCLTCLNIVYCTEKVFHLLCCCETRLSRRKKWCYLYSVLFLAFCSFDYRLVVPVTGNSARERIAFHPWSHFKERSLPAQ